MPTLFVQQLTVIDFSYLDKQRGLVGESWIVDVELDGELDKQGMVFDFGHVKKQIKQFIDNSADHKLIVPQQAKLSTTSQQTDLSFSLLNNKSISMRAPEDAILQLTTKEITAQFLQSYLETELKQQLPNNVTAIRLNLYAEDIDGAYYHYSHGLKKHLGQCQRIAHGHRSSIHILFDNQRQAELEDLWANNFKDIYIGTNEDVVAQSNDYIEFAYTAEQGKFELTLPAQQCYLIDTDTTVEHIAQHLADTISKSHPEKNICVRAFEGVKKGAVARPI